MLTVPDAGVLVLALLHVWEQRVIIDTLLGCHSYWVRES